MIKNERWELQKSVLAESIEAINTYLAHSAVKGEEGLEVDELFCKTLDKLEEQVGRLKR